MSNLYCSSVIMTANSTPIKIEQTVDVAIIKNLFGNIGSSELKTGFVISCQGSSTFAFSKERIRCLVSRLESIFLRF